MFNIFFFKKKIYSKKKNIYAIVWKKTKFLSNNFLYFFLKNNISYYFLKKINSNFLKNLSKNFFFFLKGFCSKIILEGKRFKFFLNNFFFFLKMDFSHFKIWLFKISIFLKKKLKKKKLLLISFEKTIFKSNLNNLIFLKKPNKYKKKGFYLSKFI